jgi:retron-type reverse transcriptase
VVPFDHISHDWLLTHIPTDRAILKKWLKAGYMEDRQLFPTEAGTRKGHHFANPGESHLGWSGYW